MGTKPQAWLPPVPVSIWPQDWKRHQMFNPYKNKKGNMGTKNIHSKNADRQGWHHNTELSVDLKTILRSDRRMKTGREYLGVLRRDFVCEEFLYEEHYTFIETLPWTRKRNPHLFRGKYITITRQDDGTLRLNFRPLRVGEDFSPERYATGVSNELLWALEGLVE